MLQGLKDKLVAELEKAGREGLKPANLEYICKLAETYKNLNKAEKEEVETMFYDEKMEGNDKFRGGGVYPDRIYSRGRRRDSMGRYSDGRHHDEMYSDAIPEMSHSYEDYLGAKRRYRAGAATKSDMHSTLDILMEHVVLLIEELYRECDSEEEKRIMAKHVRKIKEMM